MKTADPLSHIARALRAHRTFFIAGHLKPDGDTVGTACALAGVLRRMGKSVSLYSREKVPDNLLFVPGARRITVTDRVTRRFDCAIILECKDFARMGDLIVPSQAGTVINIDHHAVFNLFGTVNYVDPAASSSAEQVFRLFRHMGVRLSRAEATGLYVGLVTDTGMFQHSNTTPEALRMGADLVATGIRPAAVHDRLYASNSLASLHLLGEVLSTLETAAGGRIATLSLARAAFRRTGADVTETEGFVNFTLRMPAVEVGMLLREADAPGRIKVSMRSRGNCNVNRIAHRFGGGGHKHAAGCTVPGTLSSVRRLLVATVARTL